MEVFNIICGASQGLLALLSLTLLISKPFRHWFLGTVERKKEKEEKDKQIENSIKCLLRSEILKIYYKNVACKTIQYYEYENLTMMYKEYKAMGGNSFIDKIWNEIQQWSIQQ